jgi:hypothetical protein
MSPPGQFGGVRDVRSCSRAGLLRCALAAAACAGAAFYGACAQAQSSSESIDQRIESSFDLVLGNSAELAIPLTRRALARRSAEAESEGSMIAPLPYSATEDSAPEPAAVPEIGAASQSEPEIARLPRPRPQRSEDDAGPAVGAPLDLVAGAPAPEPPPLPVPPPQQLAAAPAAVADAPIVDMPKAGPARELVAAGSCLSPDEAADADGDFKRNAALLKSGDFCITEDKFKVRRRDWVLQTVTTRRPGPLWAIMHDNEDMSFDVGVAALKAYGGTLVAVETGGKRNRDGIDPNRNFSADGIGCAKLGDDAAPEYTAFFRALLADQPIIALHNDTDSEIPTGGLGHVTMKNVPKEMDVIPAAGDDSALAGDRNIVLLVSGAPIDATTARRAAALSAKGINVMVEKVTGEGDCSLSNFALLSGHPDYFNVTVDHGASDVQRGIVDVLMAGRNETVAAQ